VIESAAQKGDVIWLYQAAQKIYPRSVNGRFARWRWAMVGLTQLVFYGLPWLAWNGRQAVLFDLGSRKFYLFGVVLWPQDFIYLTGLLVMCALALFLFTAVAGRLWCGYACPQTVYTEIFLWIERRFEGDRNARMKLDQGPWNLQKLLRKGSKHLAWGAVALLTGFTFVGYFEPIRELPTEILTLSVSGWTLFWMLFYSVATWGNAGFMREQVCKYMCPYARFQSAMFDRDTLTVTYDQRRGEPRGSRPRTADPAQLNLGSCVDCTLCVQVCPTGIDIRQGLQYECIGCAACVDVCDDVMDRMNYPRGLIRYTTERAVSRQGNGPSTQPAVETTRRPMAGGSSEVWSHLLRPRTVIYATILVSIFSLWVAALTVRNPLRVDVIRDRTALARFVDDNWVENVYRLQLMNSDEHPHQYRISVSGVPAIRVASPTHVNVDAASNRSVALRIQVPEATQHGHSIPIEIQVMSDDESRPPVLEKSVFLIPSD
jgi:cytochrome c oxidase accessory protein FixG